jgi:succinate dehydrogenase / fumarate reductase cytochrome b subunit
MYRHPGKRPVYLNLFAFRFPLNAILSILHRITGVGLLLFLLTGLAWLNLWVLFPEQRADTLQALTHPLGQLIWFFAAVSLWFHWLAGVRHLMMEHNAFQWQSQPQKGRQSGLLLLALFAVGAVVIFAGVWL